MANIVLLQKASLAALKCAVSMLSQEEKDVIQLEKKLLELENKKITRLILEKEETKKKLELSEIYYLFVNDPIHKITD